MIFRKLAKIFAAVALAITFVVAAGAAGGSEAKAQGFYRNRSLGRKHATIRHRQRQRYLWNRYRQRERFRNRYYRSPYYKRYPHYRRW